MADTLQQKYSKNVANLVVELLQCTVAAYNELVEGREDLSTLQAVGVTAVHWESGEPMTLQLCLLPNGDTEEFYNV